MVWSKQKRKKENIMSVSCKSSIEVFCSASHAHHWWHKSRELEVLCPPFRDDIRKKKRKLCVSWEEKFKKKINFFCTCLSSRRSVYYTSDTYSENSLSSFAKVSEVTSNADATLLSFWVSYITYTECYYCVECNILMPKI